MLRIARPTCILAQVRSLRNVSGSGLGVPTPEQSHPNPPLELDPALRALINDVDMSLVRHKSRHPARVYRELEALPIDHSLHREVPSSDEYCHEGETPGHRDARKSPAADFGSQHIGAVVLPSELQKSISHVIADADGSQLHNDARRLFHGTDEEPTSEGAWETTYNVKYKNRRQAAYHSERDGTAFASVALPAHYSAIYSVLDHVKHRLEPDWTIQRIIDWGAGIGSGLWASLYAFQKLPEPEMGITVDQPKLRHSTVLTYLGIDKRDGLVSMAKRLLDGVSMGSSSVIWQKSFREDDKIRRSEGHDTLALSAFMLSSLPTKQARKTAIKEIWESGAHVMVLIDHNTTAGFECIAEAREYLLKVGRKEVADPETANWSISGSHAVAPCPHDAECPLFQPGSGRLVCGFTQRIQRPIFVRRTKHSGVGHEDIGYSYVVIRRGPRPVPTLTRTGRIGAVGRSVLDQETASRHPIKELQLHSELQEGHVEAGAASAEQGIISSQASEPQSPEVLQEALRLEAYGWPRLVFPPLKRSGHIIIDGCTSEGKIMRMTIPKSQGRQAYYDARKSSWGDIFPHEPKNPPQERYQPKRTNRKGGTTPTSGEDIGKRRSTDKKVDKISYNELSKELKEKKKQLRRERRRTLQAEAEGSEY